ncbi:major facilitator superfamily domain-containing protein 6 [Trichonephila inaurata madagascariensis]|uniref:Major facilitator superfamily domain-containing protein 6 n=1 Tax=Trichonephila inaurata madagascariensis TaxID=2747483 RepID=A0A8X7CEJ2_9ARAC|nr:major facilitator superfamily domain-containing protein 6 [Trichonephila inaurata madagascariensis]
MKKKKNCSGNSAIFPYIFVYAKQLGITADVIGYITATLWCVTVLTRPVLGGLADHFQKFKLVLICMLLVSIVSGRGSSVSSQPPRQASNSAQTLPVVAFRTTLT